MSDCACRECVGACRRTPGWFAPGEAEKAAALLGMAFAEFTRKYLIRDYWSTRRDSIEVLAPVKLGPDGHPLQEPGSVATFGYAFERGRCAFLGDDDRCGIHAAKPRECREAMLCVPKEQKPDYIKSRRSIVAAWFWHWRRALAGRA